MKRTALLVCFSPLAVIAGGCAAPSANNRFLTDQLPQGTLNADKAEVRAFLGLPNMESHDRRAWWNVEPTHALQRGKNANPSPPSLSIWLLYGDDEKLIAKELITYQVIDGTATLRAENIWTDAPPSDFAQTLTGKLAELVHAEQRYQLDQQPASFQFRRENQLLVTGENWTRADANLARITARFPVAEYPRLAHAVDVALAIRRFTINLRFDRATRFR